MSFDILLKRNFYPEKVAKQMTFAAASALTKTAKEGQAAVIENLPKEFTLRTNWFEPKMRFGIRIKPAKKNSLRAEVGTDAEWLDKFETGKDKTPKNRFLAIPMDNVRRNKKQLIQKSQRPAGLRGRGDVVLQTKSGPVLFQRQGRGKKKRLVALYNLETKAKIRKVSPVLTPVVKIVKGRLMRNFNEEFIKALKTAKG